MFQYEKLKPEYSHLWANCKINSNRQKQFEAAANLIKNGEETYKDLESKTGVPWYFIGLLHYRESDCNFHTHLHNGDSLRFRTVHVPRGRPINSNPPFTFEFSAIDALRYEGFTDIHDWSIERILYCLEQYNGWGYRQRGYLSAYVWAGTNSYRSGKFVSDGVFSGSVVDSQLGCAGVLKILLAEMPEDIQPSYNDEIIDKTHKASAPPNTENELHQTSRKWKLTDLRQKLTVGVGSTIAAFKLFDAAAIDSLKATFDSIKEFTVSYGVWVVFLVIAGYFISDYLMKHYMKQDVQEGRAIPSGTLINVDTGNPL